MHWSWSSEPKDHSPAPSHLHAASLFQGDGSISEAITGAWGSPATEKRLPKPVAIDGDSGEVVLRHGRTTMKRTRNRQRFNRRNTQFPCVKTIVYRFCPRQRVSFSLFTLVSSYLSCLQSPFSPRFVRAVTRRAFRLVTFDLICAEISKESWREYRDAMTQENSHL